MGRSGSADHRRDRRLRLQRGAGTGQDADFPDTTITTSSVFKIMPTLVFIDPDGDIIHVDDNATPTAFTVRWTTLGSDVSKVKLEYLDTDDTPTWIEIDDNITNASGDGSTPNTYDWTPPTDFASTITRPSTSRLVGPVKRAWPISRWSSGRASVSSTTKPTKRSRSLRTRSITF